MKPIESFLPADAILSSEEPDAPVDAWTLQLGAPGMGCGGAQMHSATRCSV